MAQTRSGSSALELEDPRPLAVAAETLFLVNLLLAPGLAFVVLAWLWTTRRKKAPAVARIHLEQAFRVSLAGGFLLGITLAIALLGGLDSPWTWLAGILYFTCVHAALILLGVVALANAINRKPWRYPLLG